MLKRQAVVQPGGRRPAPQPLDVIQDFVNTEIPEWHADELAAPGELGAWLQEHGLLAPGETVEADAYLLARDVRAAFRTLALANTVGSPSAAARARADAALARVPLRLGAARDGRLELVPSGDGTDRALGLLFVIALEAERDGTWSRMKACRKDGCGWLFYDYSRNRSGNWCSMSICGNRTKTRRYRTRRRDGA